ncbi:calcium/calmodulin-dependent protein kinase I delta short [Piromyces finnis]|uniref:Calcium/calmodulin-dependent protein kinase I delta short n=1 Tax=Piromyces finnis TaxID=1754191 RepID=A0A1Y1VFJ8_9FUNG|nr:calcium/calmodulin-dependent protein kinase I delta short [Piromyces finnis]|eukprot:ORX54885.1 calcium/calmodulin-dependent protein kinase I delta short [Piromyces finnis]
MGNMFSCCLPEKKPKVPAIPMVLEEEIKESGTSNKDIKDFYEIGKTLGVGSFAIVKECINKKTGESFAVKIIDKKHIEGQESMIKSEVNVIKQLRHPNIICLKEFYESERDIYLVTDLARGGELFDHIIENGSFTEKDAANLVKQILEAVNYMHKKNIVHRDLKPENLLFKDKNEDSPLMVTDFGLSKFTEASSMLNTSCGTPGYVAPEIISRKGHGIAVDLWSIGVITYVLLCGFQPFYGDDQAQLFKAILEADYVFEKEYWGEISENAKDFIRKLLVVDPNDRMNCEQALKHKWLTTATNTSVIENVKKFNAKKTFKKAVQAVTAANQLKQLGIKKGDVISQNRESFSTAIPGEDN